MKAIIVILLCALSQPASAIDRCMTGSWFDPSRSHEGINIEVLGDNQVVTYWYTYRFFDAREQNWLVFVGQPAQMAAFDIRLGSDNLIEMEVGSGALTQVNDNLTFDFDLVLELDQLDFGGVVDPDIRTPWCLDERCVGTLHLQRLTQPVPCD